MDLKRIKMNCVECGDCWEWTGYYEKSQPRASGKSVRLWVYELTQGVPPKDLKMVVTVSCGNMRCVAPAHVERVPKQVVVQRCAALGLYSTQLRKHRIALAKRKTIAKITMEIAREMRASKLKPKEIAAQYGQSLNLVYRVLSHKTWREYGPSPFAGLFTGLAANDGARKRA